MRLRPFKSKLMTKVQLLKDSKESNKKRRLKLRSSQPLLQGKVNKAYKISCNKSRRKPKANNRINLTCRNGNMDLIWHLIKLRVWISPESTVPSTPTWAQLKKFKERRVKTLTWERKSSKTFKISKINLLLGVKFWIKLTRTKYSRNPYLSQMLHWLEKAMIVRG